MNRAAVTLLITALTLLTAYSCSKDSSGTGPAPVRAATTIYVDSAATVDSADGSSAHPYKTVTTALNAAVAGDTIHIEAGTYSTDESFPLHLKPGNILIGAEGAIPTIQGQILDENTGTKTAIEIRNLHFTGFSFYRDAATGQVPGTNFIYGCIVDSNVDVSHGGGHNFLINGCHIFGKVTFTHGAGSSINRVAGNRIDGGIRFATGNGATDTVTDNDIWNGDLLYESGSTDACLAYNYIHNGGLIEKSGPGAQNVDYNTVDYWGNGAEENAAVLLKGSSVTFRNNIVHGFAGSGIYATSGTPTIIDSNIVQVTDPVYCILTKAGAGRILGNTMVGGSCGLHDESATTLISQNIIHDTDSGLVCASAAEIRRNFISDCAGPGMVLMGASGAVDSNYIHENGFGVIIASGSPDLGGGTAGSPGHNRFYMNNGYNLANYSASAIKAENNIWDYGIEELIAIFEIYDHTDNPSVGTVDYVPFLPPSSYLESGLMSSDRQR